jgi:autotransporter-associated beta strand protein
VAYNGNVANDNGATISGNLSMTAARTFTVNHSTAATTDLTVTAAISGSGGALVKAGNGTLDLAGTNTYNGGTTVSAGTLLVSGSITGATSVQSGATLGGTGTISGAVTVGSGGTLAPGRTTGTLDVNGLTLGAGSTLKLELGGATAGDGSGFYDQVNMTNAGGSISLDGTTAITLSLQSGYVPQSSDVFFILNRADAGAFSTTFAGAAEGATIDFGNGVSGQITYLANWNFGTGTGVLTGGNDVALYNLSVAPEPGTASSLLIGIGSLLGLQRLRRRRK